MKVNISTSITVSVKDTIPGLMYTRCAGGVPLLRIYLCNKHLDAMGKDEYAFLQLNNDDPCTLVYKADDEMYVVGEPTITI